MEAPVLTKKGLVEDYIWEVCRKYPIINASKTLKSVLKVYEEKDSVYDVVLGNLVYSENPTLYDTYLFIRDVHNNKVFAELKKHIPKTMDLAEKHSYKNPYDMTLLIAYKTLLVDRDLYTVKKNLWDLGRDFRYGLNDGDVYYTNILGTEWRIKIKDEVKLDDEVVDGLCCDTTKTIYVLNPSKYHKKDDKSYMLKRILYHEIIHAFTYQSGIGYEGFGDDEQITEWIAYQFDTIAKTLEPVSKY